ncbi:MAG TPA: NUDIX hydrolase [Pseudonocardiaceae bacterium]|nr:NUDIX hydrolase [Pseudonocardiaceae bacterium]
MNKPLNQSVALVIEDDNGGFLVVKRDENDDSLPGVWGLPAASLRPGETVEDAAARAGRDKLGVTVKIADFIGDKRGDEGNRFNHLREYRAEIIEGTPSVPQPDRSVSQYAEVRYTADPTVLFDAARQGSLCSQIYLRELGVSWS